ncbi:uncharacterized protein LOC130663188 [Microplitis mediator]|uniref:uncharacterized protein LOC130663188 n=1 Tax=Microplitis mediator TaxID=375433 RepID=UPI0025550F54|nr:uncharacterized protein LOC130663188 [Microplitis mediator]
MITVIDFNGYFTQKSHFIIKEYSLYTINNRGKIRYHSFEVDISLQEKLGAKTKENYNNYYKKYGIKWTTGTLGRRKMKFKLNKYFTKSTKIFVANNDRKSELINYLNHDPDKNKNILKIVSLGKLGYEMNFKNSTSCHYHQSPSSDNCANDNVLDMIKFVRDKKLYNTTMRANTYSIIDFNCYKYSNHLRIKEVSINRISIDGVATSRDLLVEKAIKKLDLEPFTYRAYYRKYGIKWNNGNQVPRLIRENLYYTLKRSIRTYVKDNTQKNILLSLCNEDFGNKIICLDELGYDAANTELGFTECKWHDNKAVNNCADDNVGFMTDWLFRKKLLKLKISDNSKLNELEKNVKIPSIVGNKGAVYQDMKDIKSRYDQAHGSREFSSVGNAAAASTSTVDKRKFDTLKATPTVVQYYDASASELSSANQAQKRQKIDDNDEDDDVFKMASELGIEIEDNDDDVFNLASELGIKVEDDDARMINETVAPNMSQNYQANDSNDFPINQTKEQTIYDDESAIDIALELESQTGKHTPKNIADLNPESLFKYPIDDLHNYSFSSNEFDDLLDDENDNHRSKIDVNQRYDLIDEKLLSSSVFNNPTNLFDDDDDKFNNFMDIDASLHSEAMSDNRREDNDDQENEIFDKKLLDTYIVNNPNNISFDEDEFKDILAEDRLLTVKHYNKYVDTYRIQQIIHNNVFKYNKSLKMNVVIDFNGFLNSKNYFIMKEYSMYAIDRYGNITNNKSEIMLPEIKNLNDSDSASKRNYEIYYKKYGIEWTTGTIKKNAGSSGIIGYLRKCQNVFVADKDKKQKLINYINLKIVTEKNYIPLRDLGYKINFRNSTNCHYHKSPSSNNCANDNVLDMIRLVRNKKLYDKNRRANIHSVIDFNYYENVNDLVIKELSITCIGIDGNVTSRDLLVQKPDQLGTKPDCYNKYYQRYGIKWKVGNIVSYKVMKKLKYTLKESLHLYVKDNAQKNVLLNLSNEDVGNKIICLDGLGYDVGNIELNFTLCKWHDNKVVNNCADDNVRLMIDWLSVKKLIKLKISDNSKLMKLKENVKTPSIVVNKGAVYQDMKDIKGRYDQAHGSREFSSVGNAAAASTSTVDKRKFDTLKATPTVVQYYDASASELSSANQAQKRQKIDDNDEDDDVFKMASELGIEIEDNDDDVFNLASELGIKVEDDDARMINETVAPNMSQNYQANDSNDFPINQTKEQTIYDDESAIDIALELESQTGKHTPKNIADLNPESLFKYPIDDLHNYSFSSNEFDDLLDDENDNHRSKIDVNQRYDLIDEKLLSSSVFNNPTNLFDDDDDKFNNFMDIDASLHSEAMSDNRREDNDDQENEIFDKKLLDTYIVNNPNNISFDEDEFKDILAEDRL